MKQPKFISQAQLQTYLHKKGFKTSLILNSKVTGVDVKFLLLKKIKFYMPTTFWSCLSLYIFMWGVNEKYIHVIDYR